MDSHLASLSTNPSFHSWRPIIDLVQTQSISSLTASDAVSRATALHYVAFLGTRSNYIGLLLARGADPNATTRDSLTPLFAALLAPEVCETSVRLLLLHGANPSVKYAGVAPLVAAAYRGCTAVVRLLLDWGAEVGDVSELLSGERSSALAVAIMAGDESVAVELVGRGGADLQSDMSQPSLVEQVERRARNEEKAKKCLRIVQDIVGARKAG